MGDEGSIILVEKVPDQPIPVLGIGLEAPYINEAAIQAVPEIHHIPFIQFISCYLEHHAGIDAEGSRCQDITLPHAVGNKEGFRQVTIEPDLTAMDPNRMLPLRGRITYRRCRQPKLPYFIYSLNRIFCGGAAGAGNATPTFCFSVPAISKLTALTLQCGLCRQKPRITTSWRLMS